VANIPSYLMPREWKLRFAPTLSPEAAEKQVAELAAATGLAPLTVRVCLMRGLSTAEEISRFLSPGMESLTDPRKIRDMEPAIERLARARNAGEKVRIFGDYDVDGTTGAALLAWVFREYGIAYEVRQPDRFKDGYGLNVKAVEEAVADGARVLVTVDCGITSFDAAERARELGIDLIVVDHHQLDPVKGLPPALAVINPQRPDCESGLRQLCGCGLAFYVAIALRARGRTEGWFKGADGQTREPNLKQHLDLVVMATAADMVPLTGDNRILVKHGMDVLKHSKKPGVRALLENAGLGSKDVSPGHLGFVLGPRINASGRMQSASLALELLTTENADIAMRLARDLEQLNKERAELQNQIWDEVRAEVEKGIAEGRFGHGIVVARESWHEGVVGIVASRVTETFRRPAAVLSLREDFGKGSVRSYGGKDVLGALRASAGTLLGFGGHKHAAGLTVALGRVGEFAAAFDHALAQVDDDAETLPLLIEGECQASELDVKTLTEIERLGPFGPGNPEPVFSFRAPILGHRILKDRHLKLELEAGDGVIEAIWFHAVERADAMSAVESPGLRQARAADGEQSTLIWAGVPELNRFRGRVTPSLRVRDFKA
jgi:single-stranded-DNA-specific exonuclease